MLNEKEVLHNFPPCMDKTEKPGLPKIIQKSVYEMIDSNNDVPVKKQTLIVSSWKSFFHKLWKNLIR